MYSALENIRGKRVLTVGLQSWCKQPFYCTQSDDLCLGSKMESLWISGIIIPQASREEFKKWGRVCTISLLHSWYACSEFILLQIFSLFFARAACLWGLIYWITRTCWKLVSAMPLTCLLLESQLGLWKKQALVSSAMAQKTNLQRRWILLVRRSTVQQSLMGHLETVTVACRYDCKATELLADLLAILRWGRKLP